MAKVRLGFADIALARPLTWALLKGQHADVFATSVLPHRRVAPLLKEGALDVGLVTESECEQHALEAVPDLGVVLVAGGGAAWLDRPPVGAAESAVSTDRVSECPGCEEAAARLLDSANGSGLRLHLELIEGEAAASNSTPNPEAPVLDLAKYHRDVFGTEPVVYVWAHRQGFDARQAEFALKSSLRFGLSGLGALSRELAAELSSSASRVEELLGTAVRYVRSGPPRVQLTAGRRVPLPPTVPPSSQTGHGRS